MHGTLSATNSGSRTRAAQEWFGYGRWDAPYWFVGTEPGGDAAPIWVDTWRRLGAPELCDCREHYLGAGSDKWHRSFSPPTQPNWRRLIQLLLAYEGSATDMDSVRFYQRNFWGSRHGRTAIIQCSASHVSDATPVARSQHQSERLRILRKRLQEHKPKLAVFYGMTCRDAYEHIAGLAFGADGYAWNDATLCCLLPHPCARNSAMDWVSRGQEIRNRIEPRFAQDRRPHFPAAYVQTSAF
jgi:hypothetical protein